MSNLEIKSWPKQEKIYYSQIYELVTGKAYRSEARLKNMNSLVSSLYSLAIATTSLNLVANSLRKAGIVKRSYHKRNNKYWKRKGGNHV